ncbi:MAG: hypothetical protein KDK36_20795 [Leptospiraceae bacterium]|nr:hypothetical protein [Leptospiraceae bacterium]
MEEPVDIIIINQYMEKFLNILNIKNVDYAYKFIIEIEKVLDLHNDGNFEEPLKYFFVSKLLKQFPAETHNIYFQTKPNELKNYFKKKFIPDILICSKDFKTIISLDLKTILDPSLIYQNFLSKDGKKKNLKSEKGDFWKIRKVIENIPESIEFYSYVMYFYLDEIEEDKIDPWWTEKFRDMEREEDFFVIKKNLKLIENRTSKTRCSIFEISDPRRWTQTDITTELSGLPYNLWIPSKHKRNKYCVEISTESNNYFIDLKNLKWNKKPKEISKKDRKKILWWIKFYRKEIEDHWNNKICTIGFFDALQERPIIW